MDLKIKFDLNHVNLALSTNFSGFHTMSEPSIRLNVIVYLAQLLTASNHQARLQSSWCGVSTYCKSVKFLVITWFQNWTWILNHSKGLLRINTCWNNCSTLLWNASEWKNTFYIFMISKRQIGLPTMSANQYLGTNLKLSSRHFLNQNCIKWIPVSCLDFRLWDVTLFRSKFNLYLKYHSRTWVLGQPG